MWNSTKYVACDRVRLQRHRQVENCRRGGASPVLVVLFGLLMMRGSIDISKSAVSSCPAAICGYWPGIYRATKGRFQRRTSVPAVRPFTTPLTERVTLSVQTPTPTDEKGWRRSSVSPPISMSMSAAVVLHSG